MRAFGQNNSKSSRVNGRSGPSLALGALKASLALVLPIIAIALPTGCKKADQAKQAGEVAAISRTYEGGPLRVSVRLSKDSITVAERLRVFVDASVESGYTIAALNPGEKMGEFSIVEKRTGPPALAGGSRTVTTTELTLEPFLAGEYEVAPIEVKATPGVKGAGEAVSVVTEPIKVKVTSVLADSEAPKDVAAIKDIAPAPPSRAWAWWTLGGVALAAALLPLVMRLRKKGGEEAAVVLPPYEEALERLRALLSRGLIERGEFKEFHIGISDILRRYIEDRFNVRAPERTTEEFLREATSAAVFEAQDVQALRLFLSRCDLVKFAEALPTGEQVSETTDIAKDFLERTKPRAPTPEPVAAETPAQKAA